MQALPTHSTSTSPASSLKSQRNNPSFICLFGKDIAEDMVCFEKEMLRARGLDLFSIDLNEQNMSLEEIKQAIARRLQSGSHLRLHVHSTPPVNWDNNHHELAINSSSDQHTETTRFLEEVLEMAAKLNASQKNNYPSLPIVHIQSCHAGALSKEIKPGSPLWKSAYIVIYSSKKISSPDNYGAALNIGASYIRYCAQNHEPLNPMRLFYLTGSRRGDCMRMLGGDLQGPLILHGPQKIVDLVDDKPPQRIEGTQKDIADFYLTAYETRRWEFNLGAAPKAVLADMLQTRICRHDLAGIKKLLKKYPELVNSCSSGGRAAISTAILEESKKMVHLLIKKGAVLDVLDGSGKGPVYAAVSAANPELLQTLLAKGANANEINSEGDSVLLLAVEFNLTSIAAVLLAHGADINFCHENETALLLAVNNGNEAMVELLLKHGAGPKAGLTRELADDAAARGQTAIAKILYRALQSFSRDE